MPIIAIIASLVIFYIASYVGLSINGKYAPGTWGLQDYKRVHGMAPKDWRWVPWGFENNAGKDRVPLYWLYLPLYVIDIKNWHDKWHISKADPHDSKYDMYISL
jgi:hypothetical protein